MSAQNLEEDRRPVRDWIENVAETFLFGSRWLLAPIYIGLIGGIVVVLIKFFQELWVLLADAVTSDAHDVVLGVLGLLDLALLGNLIIIVIFAGYENFVSKIGVAERSEDRPQWMGHVDFSGLKIKLIGSLVAISVIELLQDFMRAGEQVGHDEIWRIVLHLTFVVSGVLFALMDYIADKRKIMFDAHRAELEATGQTPVAAASDGI
ncbi:MAG: hypothetical protein QOI02_339 [Actinomycetota bacterium]|jgi:uncharacterized protein (TIGR00645 family)|nr:hypothetical protein [Glaciihabitans sp.]MDQ1555337.1 hypothetical protein [Actinomycetota bacterium]